MMTKLKASKIEIDHFKSENLNLRKENDNLVSNHLIGVDNLTPRPRFNELVTEFKQKIDLQAITDLKSTDAKVMFLFEKLAEGAKSKVPKKKLGLQRDSSMMLSPTDSKHAVSDVLEIPVTISKVFKAVDSSAFSEKKSTQTDEDKPTFSKLKILQRKFNDERKELG